MGPGDSGSTQRQQQGPNPGLHDATTHWATPTASANSNRGSKMAPSHGNGHGLVLAGQAGQWEPPAAPSSVDVMAWPTPAARDAKGANSEEHVTTNGTGRMHMDQLANFVAHSPSSPQVRQILSGETSSVPVVSVHGKELSPTTKLAQVLGRLRLNPAFGCWLMGWPWWWTNPGLTSFVKSEMELYRSRLQWHLSCLFAELEA